MSNWSQTERERENLFYFIVMNIKWAQIRKHFYFPVAVRPDNCSTFMSLQKFSILWGDKIEASSTVMIGGQHCAAQAAQFSMNEQSFVSIWWFYSDCYYDFSFLKKSNFRFEFNLLFQNIGYLTCFNLRIELIHLNVRWIGKSHRLTRLNELNIVNSAYKPFDTQTDSEMPQMSLDATIVRKKFNENILLC